MPKQQEKINLSIGKSNSAVLFNVQKYNDVELTATVSELPSLAGYTISLYIYKQSSKQLINQIENITTSGSGIVINIKNGAFDSAGICQGQFLIKDSAGQVSSAIFYFSVTESITDDNAVVNQVGVQVIDRMQKDIELLKDGGVGGTGHIHSNKAVLDGITQAKVDKWDSGTGGTTDLSNYYTKSQVDTALTSKAPTSHNHSDLYYDKVTVDNKIANAGSGGTVDLSSYQTKTDNTLTTTAKTVVGAINENKSSLDNLTTRVTNVENSGGVISTIEPNYTDIPKVYFEGDLSEMSKDVEKILKFSYKSLTKKINGYVKMKWQGTSSLTFPKKNFTIKMYKEIACTNKDNYIFKDWGYSTNKYVLKANYIDHLHARNIVSARLWSDVVANRTDYNNLPLEYINMPNNGAVDGFPIKLYINGKYEGLYTWNIGKEGWTYGMLSEKPEYAVLCGEDYVSGCFRSTANIDESDWSLEFPSKLQASIKTSFNNAITFVMNNDGTAFKNGLSTYFDVPSLIDYYIFAYFSCGLDSLGKNQIYTTYNGTKWYAHMYDMDSTWGLYWDGSSFVSTSYRCQEDYESMYSGRLGNLLYMKLVQNFGTEIYTRYQELRQSALNITNVIDRFERFTDIINSDLYKEDLTIYTGIPSGSSNNILQIRNYLQSRATYVDGKMTELNTTPIPVTALVMSKPTTTVNVGSTDTLTVSYTPSNTTQIGVTWSSSNTGIATVSNGVVTGIANGTCTITATSIANNSITATCNITVQTVNINVESVSLNSTNNTIMELATVQLTATILPSNATNKNVTWSSSNTGIATVNNGLVTGVSSGTATITVTTNEGNKTATCTINVITQADFNYIPQNMTYVTGGINTNGGFTTGDDNVTNNYITLSAGLYSFNDSLNSLTYKKIFKYTTSGAFIGEDVNSVEVKGNCLFRINSECKIKFSCYGDLTNNILSIKKISNPLAETTRTYTGTDLAKLVQTFTDYIHIEASNNAINNLNNIGAISVSNANIHTVLLTEYLGTLYFNLAIPKTIATDLATAKTYLDANPITIKFNAV